MYTYPNCGFDVWLLSGYEIVERHGEQFVRFEDVSGLHKAIASALVSMNEPMTGAQFRFLRKYLDLSQSDLADYLNATEQTVSLWERSNTRPPPFLAEVAVRQLVSEELGLPSKPLMKRLRTQGGPHSRVLNNVMIQLEFADGTWIAIPQPRVEKVMSFYPVADVAVQAEPLIPPVTIWKHETNLEEGQYELSYIPSGSDFAQLEACFAT